MLYRAVVYSPPCSSIHALLGVLGADDRKTERGERESERGGEKRQATTSSVV